jgi:hypothetical protein
MDPHEDAAFHLFAEDYFYIRNIAYYIQSIFSWPNRRDTETKQKQKQIQLAVTGGDWKGNATRITAGGISSIDSLLFSTMIGG